MSAEILRRATEAIRTDPSHEGDAFLLAVADWLDDTAGKCERRGCLGWASGGLRCGAPFDEHGPGGYRHVYIEPQPPAPAIAVARAYLGEPA